MLRLMAAVNNFEEAKLALETLEYGTDGVLTCLQMKFPRSRKVTEFIEKIDSENYPLVPATVTRVEPVGSGDRVCVDTCSMMKVGEGMLIGSYSKGTFPGSQ